MPERYKYWNQNEEKSKKRKKGKWIDNNDSFTWKRLAGIDWRIKIKFTTLENIYCRMGEGRD